MKRKLLFDQNISYKIVYKLKDLYPNSSHVRLENLQFENDKKIREFALSNEFIIVTFDIDFYEMTILYGFPPKVIWLRCGNTSTNYISKILSENFIKINEFLEDNKFACLELF